MKIYGVETFGNGSSTIVHTLHNPVYETDNIRIYKFGTKKFSICKNVFKVPIIVLYDDVNDLTDFCAKSVSKPVQVNFNKIVFKK